MQLRWWKEYITIFLSKYHSVHGAIIADRLGASDKVKKTLFADSTYEYEAMPIVHVPEFKAVWLTNNYIWEIANNKMFLLNEIKILNKYFLV